MGVVFIGGAALVAALVVGYSVGGTVNRTALLLLAGAVALAVWLAAIYLAAPPTSESPDCSDCGDHLGRWIDAAAVFVVVGGNAVAWIIGVVVGSSVRWLRRRRTT